MLLMGDQLVAGSVYRLLAEHGDVLFGDESFADLFNLSALGLPTADSAYADGATPRMLAVFKAFSVKADANGAEYRLRAGRIMLGSADCHGEVLFVGAVRADN